MSFFKSKFKRIISIFLCLSFIKLPVLGADKNDNLWINEFKNENYLYITPELAEKYLNIIEKNTIKEDDNWSYIGMDLKDINNDNIPELIWLDDINDYRGRYATYANLLIESKDGSLYKRTFSPTDKFINLPFDSNFLYLYHDKENAPYLIDRHHEYLLGSSGHLVVGEEYSALKLENGKFVEKYSISYSLGGIEQCEAIEYERDFRPKELEHYDEQAIKYIEHPHTITYTDENLKKHTLEVNTHQEGYKIIEDMFSKMGNNIEEYLLDYLEKNGEINKENRYYLMQSDKREEGFNFGEVIMLPEDIKLDMAGTLEGRIEQVEKSETVKMLKNIIELNKTYPLIEKNQTYDEIAKTVGLYSKFFYNGEYNITENNVRTQIYHNIGNNDIINSIVNNNDFIELLPGESYENFLSELEPISAKNMESYSEYYISNNMPINVIDVDDEMLMSFLKQTLGKDFNIDTLINVDYSEKISYNLNDMMDIYLRNKKGNIYLIDIFSGPYSEGSGEGTSDITYYSEFLENRYNSRL